MIWEKIRSFLVAATHSNSSFKTIAASVFMIVSIAHLYQLDSVPSGFSADESAIGYNAALVAQTGKDEYGIYLPTYFRSFDDYKAPVYIYAAALVFKLFGVSELNLRLTSFTFYVLALVFWLTLIYKIFPSSKVVWLYGLLAFGFIPHFFAVSRLSFEVISYLSATSATVLLVWRVFHERQEGESSYLEAILCGFALGVSVYAYPTGRVLSFLTFISLWIIYWGRTNIKNLIAITSTFLVCLVPYFLFAANNPGALTLRFRSISYLYSSKPLLEKAITFVHNYLVYWFPGFLVRSGDMNLRHGTGYGGVIFSITWLLFLLGLLVILTNRALLTTRFNFFLLVNLLLAPASAALTSEGSPHALRSLLISYYILLISCYGLKFTLSIKNHYRRQGLIAGVMIVLLVEIIGHQVNYFTFYPPKSARAMDSLNFRESLQAAVDQNPREVLFLEQPSETAYAHLKFSSYLIDNPKKIPIKQVESPSYDLNSCILYNKKYEETMARLGAPFSEHEISKDLNPIQRFLGAEKYPTIMKVRCYKSPI